MFVDIAMTNIPVAAKRLFAGNRRLPRRDIMTRPRLQSGWRGTLARPVCLKNRFQGLQIGDAAKSANKSLRRLVPANEQKERRP